MASTPSVERRCGDSVQFRSIDDLQGLITSFEECTLHPSRWNHETLLAVALWYLHHLPECQATTVFISKLLRYNHANGIEPIGRRGYHETLTLFWLTIARQFHAQTSHRASLVDVTNEFIHTYGANESLFLQYYSEDLIWSWRARLAWTEPDLKPIDGALE